MAEKKPKPELPLSLRAGNIRPMEGMAAPKPPEYYVTDCAYVGYPMIRGQRIFVVADGGEVKYQVDKGVIPAPDIEIGEAFARLYAEVGSFVLEGVMVYPDADGKSNKSGARDFKEAKANSDANRPVQAEFHMYRSLYHRHDLRRLAESYRHRVTGTLVRLMEHPGVKIVPMYNNQEDKEHLLHNEVIWVLRDAVYRSGLDENRQPMVVNSR